MRTRVTRRWIQFAATASLVFLSGCLDKVAAVRLMDIVGTWQLIHLNRTAVTTGETTDALSDGSTMSMTVAADGTLTTVTTTGGGAPVNGTGTVAVAGNQGKLVLDGQNFYGNFFLKDGVWSIDCGTQAGLEDFTRVTFIFQRP